MKRILLISTILLLAILMASAQAPNKFKYQTVIRNSSGEVLKNQSVALRLSILQSSATGTSVYSETHKKTTNEFGLVNLEIGSGTLVTGTMPSINWSTGIYYIKVELDAANGTNFTSMGTSQLLSVPYALYATKSDNGLNLTTTPKAGDILYNNGTGWDLLSKGTEMQVLKIESGLPKWKQLSEYSSVIPAANFTVSQLLATTNQTIQVDASSIIDDVDPIATLQVRWKWEDSGTFTTWGTTKTATKQYTTEGSKNITLEVKDKEGNIGTSSKAIVINNQLFMPVVTTLAATDILQTTANSGGNIQSTGGTDITARGICWATTQNPTIENSKTTNGTGLGSFSSALSALAINTTYYVRAYATNATGTAYGNQIIFKTYQTVVFPTVTTALTVNITKTGATGGGNVTATGGAEVIARGVCWSLNQNPTIDDNKTIEGTGTGQFNCPITSLDPGKTYYVKAFATNSSGTGYGDQNSFKTTSSIPVVQTKDVTNVIENSAIANGYVLTDAGSTVTERGVCYSTAPNPDITDKVVKNGTGSGSYTCALNTLIPNTTYYVRAYAINVNGTVYGESKSFTTLEAYYVGFENGMPAGWKGHWAVSTDSPFEGNYCLKTTNHGDSIVFSKTITNPNGGQISFFHSSQWTWTSDNSCFYIDNIRQVVYSMENWNQHTFPVCSGFHTFKWVNTSMAKEYIDYIIITK